MARRTDANATADLTIHRLAEAPHIVPLLSRWLQQQWPRAYGPERARTTIESLTNRDRLPLALVASTPGLGPVGMTAVVEGTTPTEQPVAILMALYVVPAQRRRGVGAALCRRAAAEARRLGWQGVGAYTVDSEDFYQRIGWRIVTRAVITSEPEHRRVWYVEQPEEPARDRDRTQQARAVRTADIP